MKEETPPRGNVIDFRAHLNRKEERKHPDPDERKVLVPRPDNDPVEPHSAEVTPISFEARRTLLINSLGVLCVSYLNQVPHQPDKRLGDKVEEYAIDAKEEIQLSNILPSADVKDPHWIAIYEIVQDAKNTPDTLDEKSAQGKIQKITNRLTEIIESIPEPKTRDEF